MLKRGDRPAPYEVWYSSLRDPLPNIAVALRPPFADVPLRLQAALDSVYAEACYNDQLSYSAAPPLPPLSPTDSVSLFYHPTSRHTTTVSPSAMRSAARTRALMVTM